MALEFDPLTHTYTLDGRRVPSVTQIIRAVIPRKTWATDWHMNRGTQLHAACALLDQGVLDWATVDKAIEPQVRAWESFVKAFGWPMNTFIETPLARSDLQFAGTIDRVFRHPDGVDCIVDIKSSLDELDEIQLGGYSLLWDGYAGLDKKRKAALVVLEGDKFRAHNVSPTKLRIAEHRFLACLTVYNTLAEYDLLPKESQP